MTWENLRIEISDGAAVVTIWDAGVSEETPPRFRTNSPLCA